MEALTAAFDVLAAAFHHLRRSKGGDGEGRGGVRGGARVEAPGADLCERLSYTVP